MLADPTRQEHRPPEGVRLAIHWAPRIMRMKSPSRPDLSRIPSMTDLLKAAASDPSLRDVPRGVVMDALRQTVDDVRARMSDGRAGSDCCDRASMLAQAATHIQSARASRLRRVINATGIVLHTNLGRSVLAEAA